MCKSSCSISASSRKNLPSNVEKEGNPKQKLIHLKMTMTMLVMRMYDDDDDDDDDGDDICFMMNCVFVCLSQKIITSSLESPVTTRNHPVQLQVSCHVFFLHSSRLFSFMFPGPFLWFLRSQVTFSCFQVGFHGVS